MYTEEILYTEEIELDIVRDILTKLSDSLNKKTTETLDQVNKEVCAVLPKTLTELPKNLKNIISTCDNLNKSMFNKKVDISNVGTKEEASNRIKIALDCKENTLKLGKSVQAYKQPQTTSILGKIKNFLHR